ncbi:MAG: fibronectin type III domain-containing protein, partial [Acidimicrobiales bacterium]|nr:fibronectin type III domain-containing protein [Acidimicrobiales bacterium]
WWPFTYGQPGDVPMVADFDGEGKSSIGVFRPSTGEFLRVGQPAVMLGQFGDVPAPLGVGVAPRAAGPPVGVTASAGNQSATVAWQAPGSNGGTTIIGYRVTAVPGNVSTTVGPTALQATLTGLANGTTYRFTVTALNVVGAGVASVLSNPVTPMASSGVPGPPSSVSAYAGFQQATVSWIAPVQNGGSPITGYSVVASPGGASATVSASQTSATLTGLTNGVTYTFTVTAINANGPGSASFPSNPVTPPGFGGGFHPLSPQRIFDTRDGTGGPASKLGPGEERAVTVTGVGGVPTDNVGAVVMNVTVTGPTAASHLTVWPGDQERPVASNLNFIAGQTIPNLVVARVSPSGALKVFNNAGSTHVIFDVVGWYDNGAGGDRYTPLAPARILDTRDGTGGGGGMIGPGEVRSVKVTGVGEVPANSVTAVVMNVTVTGPTAASHLTVWPADRSMPVASNLNFIAGQTAPNLVMAKVSPDGFVKVFNNAGSTHVIFDIVGYFSGGGTNYTALAPRRVLDTRVGLGGPSSKLGPGQQRQVLVVGTGGVPPSGVNAVVINVTATGPTAPSHLTVWPFGWPMPVASSLNVSAGETRANLVVAKVGGDGTVWVFNNSGYVDVVIDVVGYFS